MYRLNLCISVFVPPSGSDATNPDVTLAPIITTRSHGDLSAARPLAANNTINAMANALAGFFN